MGPCTLYEHFLRPFVTPMIQDYLQPQKRLRASKWCSCSRCSRLETKSSSRNILSGESREREKVRSWRTSSLVSRSDTLSTTITVVGQIRAVRLSGDSSPPLKGGQEVGIRIKCGWVVSDGISGLSPGRRLQVTRTTVMKVFLWQRWGHQSLKSDLYLIEKRARMWKTNSIRKLQDTWCILVCIWVWCFFTKPTVSKSSSHLSQLLN